MVEQEYGRDSKWESVKTRPSPFSIHTTGPKRTRTGYRLSYSQQRFTARQQPQIFPTQVGFLKNYLKWEDSKSNFGTARSNSVIRRISHVYRVLLGVIYMQVKQISPTFLGKCQIPYWFTRFTISLTSEGLPAVWITGLWPPSNTEWSLHTPPFKNPIIRPGAAAKTPRAKPQPCGDASPLPIKPWGGGEREIKVGWWKCQQAKTTASVSPACMAEPRGSWGVIWGSAGGEAWTLLQLN